VRIRNPSFYILLTPFHLLNEYPSQDTVMRTVGQKDKWK
jgi:hypothetical protein